MIPWVDNFQSALAVLDIFQSCLGDGGSALLDSLQEIIRISQRPIYLVGGSVRDSLLGLPVTDLDLVVDGPAPTVSKRLANRLGGRAIIHSRFGTASVIWETPEGLRVDLVTARREVYPRPGSLPQVFPGTIYDDLARRDFSVNAMALPLSGTDQQLLTPAGGIDDLNRGVIRILHPASFVDDPTRLLRAARYEQRLGFRLERDTESRLRTAVAQGCLNTVSGDRLRHELARMFAETRPGPPLLRTAELGILPAIHPGWGWIDYLQRWAESSLEIIAETGLSSTCRELTWLAALVYPSSAGAGEGLISRLNMPKAWATVVRDTVALRQQERVIADPALPPSRLCALLDGFSPVAVAVVAGLTDSPAVSRSLRRYLAALRHIKPALRGDDLLAMGVPPGPAVGVALAQLRAARQDGHIRDAAGERRWVAEWLAANNFME